METMKASPPQKSCKNCSRRDPRPAPYFFFVNTMTCCHGRLVVFDSQNGKEIQSLETTGDADDVFWDARRKRIYVIGGEGTVAVVQQSDLNHYSELTRVATHPGTRTGFFSPELDRLFVAVRQEGGHRAEVRIYMPE